MTVGPEPAEGCAIEGDAAAIAAASSKVAIRMICLLQEMRCVAPAFVMTPRRQ
jgi:hypothetical protein